MPNTIEHFSLADNSSGDELAKKLLHEADVIFAHDGADHDKLIFGREAMLYQMGSEAKELKMVAVGVNGAEELQKLLDVVVAAKGWHDYEAPQDGQN
jgi:hypothetical protein